MGTNYYLRPPGACATQCSSWIHLGKSSVGWAFTFRAYPETAESKWEPEAPVVTDYASWVALLDKGEIYNEYGDPIRRENLLELIENKRGGLNEVEPGHGYLDADGNKFIGEWFS